MVRMPIEFIADAEHDVDDAFNWYFARSTEAASRFLVALRNSIELIAAGPEHWPLYAETTRSCPLRKFPYRVVFVVMSDRVRVVAVTHERRKPGYWNKRS
ncbi:MAG: type II toxin-antitoxin system RelE/ParE family toxin [Pirellulales bacterium]|nr:type II toxin-antitoxin system RelE/ParE family toxin [Pirellulales bacterium]